MKMQSSRGFCKYEWKECHVILLINSQDPIFLFQLITMQGASKLVIIVDTQYTEHYLLTLQISFQMSHNPITSFGHVQ